MPLVRRRPPVDGNVLPVSPAGCSCVSVSLLAFQKNQKPNKVSEGLGSYFECWSFHQPFLMWFFKMSIKTLIETRQVSPDKLISDVSICQLVPHQSSVWSREIRCIIIGRMKASDQSPAPDARTLHMSSNRTAASSRRKILPWLDHEHSRFTVLYQHVNLPKSQKNLLGNNKVPGRKYYSEMKLCFFSSCLHWDSNFFPSQRILNPLDSKIHLLLYWPTVALKHSQSFIKMNNSPF